MPPNVLVLFAILAVGLVMAEEEEERSSSGQRLVVTDTLPYQGDPPKTQVTPASELPHKDYQHNIPPPPDPSSNSYIATLSYGEAYPTIVYHCSVVSASPEDANVVKGPGGHVCTVSYQKNYGHHHQQHHATPSPQASKDPISTLLDMILPVPEKTSIKA